MAQPTNVLSNWHTLVDDFSTSGQDFYTAVEERVKARDVPGVTFKRIISPERGIGSARREYLRIRRKRVAFDLGAAPFGTGYFFSWWLVQLGPRFPMLWLLGFLLVVVFLPLGFAGVLLEILQDPSMRRIDFSSTVPYGIAAAVVILSIPVFGLLVGLLFGWLADEGLFGPPEKVLQIPVAGWLYRVFFNPNTYHALDTAMMFQESIRRSVNEALDETLTGQGLRALSEEALQPTIRDLTR